MSDVATAARPVHASIRDDDREIGVRSRGAAWMGAIEMRLVASAALRCVVLIAIAMLLILVLLPAVLGAQAASAG